MNEAAQFAAVAATLQAETDPPLTGALIAESALDLIPDARHASLTVWRRRKFQSLGITSEAAGRADALQYELDEGPCVESIEGAMWWFRSGDIHNDHRWPTWGPQAADLGMRSVLSIALLAQERRIGSLNLYGEETGLFSDSADIDHALVYATHAALALSSAHQLDDLETAMTSRHIIGMAQGIAMERYTIGQEAAFDLLRRLSSQHNIKLRDLAREIVATRSVPTAR